MMGELMKEIVNGRISKLFCITEPYRKVNCFKTFGAANVCFYSKLTLYSTGTAELRNCAFGRSLQGNTCEICGKTFKSSRTLRTPIYRQYVKLTGDISDSSLFLIVTLI